MKWSLSAMETRSWNCEKKNIFSVDWTCGCWISMKITNYLSLKLTRPLLLFYVLRPFWIISLLILYTHKCILDEGLYLCWNALFYDCKEFKNCPISCIYSMNTMPHHTIIWFSLYRINSYMTNAQRLFALWILCVASCIYWYGIYNDMPSHLLLMNFFLLHFFISPHWITPAL